MQQPSFETHLRSNSPLPGGYTSPARGTASAQPESPIFQIGYFERVAVIIPVVTVRSGARALAIDSNYPDAIDKLQVSAQRAMQFYGDPASASRFIHALLASDFKGDLWYTIAAASGHNAVEKGFNDVAFILVRSELMHRYTQESILQRVLADIVLSAAERGESVPQDILDHYRQQAGLSDGASFKH